MNFWEIYRSKNGWQVREAELRAAEHGRVRYDFVKGGHAVAEGRTMKQAVLKFQIAHPRERLWRVWGSDGEYMSETDFERVREEITI